MTRRLIVFVLALVLWPASAFAAKSFWAWLEELSGPGPFKGYVFSVPVTCVQGGEGKPCWQVVSRRESGRYQRVVLRVGYFDSGDNLRFKDLPDTLANRETVRVWSVSGNYMFHIASGIELGPGAGFMRFSGSGFDPIHRATVTPVTVSVAPFLLGGKWKDRRAAHLLRFEFEEMLVTKGFKGADFGNTATSFSVGAEFLARVGFVVDFSSLVWRC